MAGQERAGRHFSSVLVIDCLIGVWSVSDSTVVYCGLAGTTVGTGEASF